jgi:hypothetical protein
VPLCRCVPARGVLICACVLRAACRCVPARCSGLIPSCTDCWNGKQSAYILFALPCALQESDLSSQTVTLDVTAATDLSAENEERANLLAYYQRQCAQFEQDQHDSLQRFAALEVSHQEMHKLRWQNRVQREEIAELQKAVSNSNVALYEERAQVLKLQAENEHLRIQVLRFVRGTGVSRVVLTCAPRSWRTAAASSTCWR